ncbi:hypothetical protein CLIM01_00050 [Colletotrichum limetticola]|uniref:Uncharacterized protein n=1 Tax=Colletotrichum limetticola TaxID=1209924 RepID=A0ABQ9QFS6_9PEZI|nr:hypothetical protein CLIM01_00050 [Colletotrichum limetticola]
MASFEITIKNRSNNNQSFILLQDIQVTGNLGQNNVFSNVYQSSPNVNGMGARTEFFMKQQYYAIQGTSSNTGDGSIRVNVSDSVPAKLGPNGTTAAVTTVDGFPTWNRSQMAKPAQGQGSFDLLTDNTFKSPNPNQTYVGCGAPDPRTGEVIPVKTWLAQPGVNSQVIPRPRYFIASGHFRPGVIVDMRSLGRVLTVDFAGAAIPSATFTLTNDGTYQPDGQVAVNGVKWSFGDVDGA